MAKEFDPTEAKADEVKAKLEKADADERARIVAAERQGKARKSVLEAAGVDPSVRTDASGRELYPWEVSPENQVRVVDPEESADEQAAREAQAEADARVAAASPQGGTTPADSGTTAGGTAGATAGAGGTAATTA